MHQHYQVLILVHGGRTRYWTLWFGDLRLMFKTDCSLKTPHCFFKYFVCTKYRIKLIKRCDLTISMFSSRCLSNPRLNTMCVSFCTKCTYKTDGMKYVVKVLTIWLDAVAVICIYLLGMNVWCLLPEPTLTRPWIGGELSRIIPLDDFLVHSPALLQASTAA